MHDYSSCALPTAGPKTAGSSRAANSIPANRSRTAPYVNCRKNPAYAAVPPASPPCVRSPRPSGSDTFIAFHTDADHGEPQPDRRETDAARFFSLAEIEELHADKTIVRLHRIIAHHVLDPGSQPTEQTLPARDRLGNPGTATVYLL